MAIQQLTLKFENEISAAEVKLLRGAVIAALQNDNVLFHNHIGEGLRYAYPLIQYKRIGGKAAIVCIGEGVNVIGEFFNKPTTMMNLGNRQVDMKLADIRPSEFTLNQTPVMQSYVVRGWLPLNGENYHQYISTPSLGDKIKLLEQVMVGNLLSMGKGLGVHWEEPLTCCITSVLRSYPKMYKSIRLMAFDVEMKCNLRLPSYIGIGKNVSLGSGTIYKKRALVGHVVVNKDNEH